MTSKAFGLIAIACLAVCLLSALLFFTGRVGEIGYKNAFLAASLAWFVFGMLWLREKKAP